MAGETVKVLVDINVKGREKLTGATAGLKDLTRETDAAQKNFKQLTGGIGFYAGAVIGAAFATKKLYDTMRAGAQLQTTTERFDKLSASIGTTADTMLGKLRTATQGMISDAELMANASQIMSLKLADTEDQVIRLATVAGTLNWDMQQVILTFANMSTMRLDALGLSVEEVTAKAKELEAAGMTAQQAFKEAVILAGEARLDVGGVSDQEKAFKEFEASITNAKNELAQTAIELAVVIGLVEDMSNMAAGLQLRRQIAELNAELERAGRITWWERWVEGINNSGRSIEEYEALVATKLKQVDNALLFNTGAWQGWAKSTMVSTAATARAIVADMNAAFLAITGLDQGLRGLDWMGGPQSGGPPSPLIPPGQKMASLFPPGFAAQSDMALAMWGDVVTGANEASAAVSSYGGGLSYVNEQEQALLETHSRMVSAFQQEAGMDLAEGLINAEGLVNIENANKALYEQAQAAGVSASGLALLGVATGQLTDEQAQAALKAAVLMERIKQLAAGVASGDLSIGDALGGLGDFRAQLDSGAFAGAAGGIEGLATAAEEFANNSYQATMEVEAGQAIATVRELQGLADNYAGTYTAHFQATYDPVTGGPTGNGTGRAGAPISVNQPAAVSTETTSGRSGGAVYNVSVTNYVDGKQAAKGSLDDITRDKMAAALRGLGLGGR